MISEDDLKVVSLNQADRHHSYDLVQKLTFLVIGAELVFCGYILLNAEKLSGVRHSSILFLVAGLAGLFGILWRFCYNQTYHENVHERRSRFHSIWYSVQISSYWVYIVLTAIFFVGSLCAGYNYVNKAEQSISPKTVKDGFSLEGSKALQAISQSLEKISKDDSIRVEVVIKSDSEKSERVQIIPRSEAPATSK